MKPPTAESGRLVVTNGRGRLFIQTLLPTNSEVRLVTGVDLYTCDGRSYPPQRDTGPASECRIEVSPGEPREMDYFLHVLTATDADVAEVEKAVATIGDGRVRVTLGAATITFTTNTIGGSIELSGRRINLTETIVLPAIR